MFYSVVRSLFSLIESEQSILFGDKGKVCLWSKNVLFMVNALFLFQDRYTISLVNRNVMITTNQERSKKMRKLTDKETKKVVGGTTFTCNYCSFKTTSYEKWRLHNLNIHNVRV